jgi:hypothetical protein
VSRTQIASDLDARVRRVAVGVPAAGAIACMALEGFDPRVGLAGAAVVLGWTKLVGL